MLIFVFAFWGLKSTQWDDFSNWITTVKGMWLHGTFSTFGNLKDTFSSYPVAMGVIQYFTQMLYHVFNSSLEFSEWLCHLTFHAYALALTLPFWCYVKKKIHYIFLVLLSLFFPLIFNVYFYRNAYIDSFLSLLMVSIVCVILFEKSNIFSFIFVLLGIFTLVNTKDIGFYFSIFISILYGIKQETFRKRIIYFISSFFIAVLAKILWSLHLSLNGVVRAFNDHANGFANVEFDFLKQVLKNFTKYFLFESQVLNLSFVVLFLTGFILLGFLLSRCFNKKQAFLIWLTLGLAGIIYILSLPFIYAINFPPYQALTLAEAWRYLGIPCSFLWGLNILIYFLNTPKSAVLVCISVLCVSIAWMPFETFITRVNVKSNRMVRHTFDEFVNFLQLHLPKEPSDNANKIFIVSQKNIYFPWAVFKLGLMPYTTNPSFDLYIDLPENFWNSTYNYKYLALFEYTEEFEQAYTSLFKDAIQKGLYCRTDSGFELISPYNK